jgi:hypothetical protein
MQLILLVAGLILLLAVTAPWAATVGWICLGVFALLTVLQIAALVAVRRTQKSMLSRFDRGRW